MSKKNELPVDTIGDDLVAGERQFWRDQGQTLIKGSIDVLDGVAKELIAVAGILEGLYFHAITLSDLRDKTKYPALLVDQHLFWYLAPIGLLLGSLTLAVIVFFPQSFRLNMHSSEASHIIFERTATFKLWLVRFSAVLLVFGVLATLFAAGLYLTTQVP